MAVQGLSATDIFKLSQKAWKISRAFSAGKHGAVAEFTAIEREAEGLGAALQLITDTLHADDSILEKAKPRAVEAVEAILDSAHRTLADLQSFVETYQVMRKRETSGGFVVERSWPDYILANYKTIEWTTEGGSIDHLRNMLNMHTSTINLALEALQVESLSRIERTIVPVAKQVESIHDRLNGDLGQKIDDLHRLVMAVVEATPPLATSDRSYQTQIHPLDLGRRDSNFIEVQARPGAQRTPPQSGRRRPSSSRPHDSVLSTTGSKAHISPLPETNDIDDLSPFLEQDIDWLSWRWEPGNPSELGSSKVTASSASPQAASSRTSVRSIDSRSEPERIRAESMTLPDCLRSLSTGEAISPRAEMLPWDYRRTTSVSDTIPSGKTMRSSRSSIGKRTPSTPRMPLDSLHGLPQPTANSSLSTTSSPRSQEEPTIAIAPRAQGRASLTKSPTLASLASFEKTLLNNSAILCDARAVLIEHTQRVPNETDERRETEMIEVCTHCRVYVIRKRERRAHAGDRLTTSVWILSEDGSVRCQQRLSEIFETVPYGSTFEQERVSIPATAAGDHSLEFCGDTWDDDLVKTVRTNWINYAFATENDAIRFQEAIFGRKLIGSFKTLKTVVVHEGLKGAFAYEEQFAHIEMLKLWEDDGIATPGGQGGILALIHMSSNFATGSARWWMNCSRQQVRVRHDGDRHAKLKGIKFVLVQPGTITGRREKIRNWSSGGELQRASTDDVIARFKSAGRKVPVKTVTGLRIEFEGRRETDEFLRVVRRAQERMIPLPDL